MFDALDALMLARIQFAANISFHILFPTISIALAWFLVVFRLTFAATGDPKWNVLFYRWVSIFAVTFALGVVTGVVMSFQFGTNWPGYMEKVGNIAGPLLAYEVLTAFMLEATFISILLFGRGRVPEWMHTMSAVLVATGTTLSAFWILSLNSWMQTPAGHVMRDGVAHPESWLAILFNPSMPYRLTHMLLASCLTAAFLVAGLSAWRWLRGHREPATRAGLTFAVTVAAVAIPIQMFVGDAHGLNTLKHQPQKIAAMEANWETQSRMPLLLFAWPDEKAQKNDFEIGIPLLGSLILTHKVDGVVPGLKDFKDRPPVKPLFFGFRIMVGVGLLMLATSWLALFAIWRQRNDARGLFIPDWTAWMLVGMTFAGWVATLAGWYVTEIGRQPWLVTGILRTADAAGPVDAASIGTSLIGYLGLYLVLGVTYVSVLFRMAAKAEGAQ